jgi:solute carrier family 8 (sodium/calcium exchanger)
MLEVPPVRFQLILEKPEFVKFDPNISPPELTRRSKCTVNFHFSNPYMVRRTRILKYIMSKWEPTWFSKFQTAVEFGPTIDEYEVVQRPSCCRSLLQFVALPWRIMGAAMPPINYCGGWPAAIGTFFAIGTLTYILIEISAILSCYTGINVCLQAILGISTILALPDTFAAYNAAVNPNSQYADPCIGTAAGANAVAIFIGLGLPWVNATVYHWAKYGQDFYIGKESTIEITFALILFLVCSATCYIILFFRRLCVGGELGGSKVVRYISGFIMFFLWAFFIVMNALHCAKLIKADFGTDLPDQTD